MLFVIANADGSMQRIATTPLEPDLENGQSVVVFNDRDMIPDPAAEKWNPATLVFDEIVQAGSPSYARTKLTNREFLQRLDAAGALDQMLRVLATPLTASSTVQERDLLVACMKFDRYLTNSDGVELTHLKVQEATGLFLMVGWLTTQSHTTLLAPSTVAEE